VNPARQNDILVQVLFQLGGEGCTLEMGNVAGWAVRQSCSAWNRTRCLFF
jgi:dihydrodipicolinate synthase/N-acetylneuraminate lyase